MLRGVTTWVVAALLTASMAAATTLPRTDDAAAVRAAAPFDTFAAAAIRRAAPPSTTTAPAPVVEAPQATAAKPAAAKPAASTGLPAVRLQAALDQFHAANPGVTASVGVSTIGANGDSWTAGSATTAPTANTPNQPYGVLSITKTFTEALVLREAAAGRINLDAAVPQLPGVAELPAGVVITPRMLLQHTSGLVNYASAVGYDPNATITPPQLVSLSLKSPLTSPPGTKAAYSNTNFHWLGLLVEHVTGRTFADLVAGLAAEAGLANTALDPTGRPGWIGFASGGVRGTVTDMAQWGAALFTPGRILAAADVKKLTTVGPLGVSHGLWPMAGGVGQFIASGGMVHYPAEGLVVVVRIEPGTPATGEQFATLATAMRTAATR